MRPAILTWLALTLAAVGFACVGTQGLSGASETDASDGSFDHDGASDGSFDDDGHYDLPPGCPSPDCTNPACTAGGFRCVRTAPPMWTGPTTLYVGSTEPPPCSAPYGQLVLEGGADLEPSSGACTCDCAPSADGYCAVTVWAVDGCVGNLCHDQLDHSEAGACHLMRSCNATNLGLSAGMSDQWRCVPHPSPPPAPTWRTLERVCEIDQTPLQGGCAPGFTCAPPARGGYQSGCIYRSGQVPCPEGFDGKSAILNESVAEGRTCVGCTCAQTSSGCGSVSFYSSTDCSGTAIGTSTPTTPSCTLGAMSARYSWTSPTCAVTDAGAVDDGSVAPANASTVCCAR